MFEAEARCESLGCEGEAAPLAALYQYLGFVSETRRTIGRKD